MGIQIFGTKKSADTRKAERFFSERNIRVQVVDLKEKGMSKGELESVLRAVGSLDDLIDPAAKDQKALLLIKYLAEEDRFDKLLENQQLLRQPIVRNGRKAAVGCHPEIWKEWAEAEKA